VPHATPTITQLTSDKFTHYQADDGRLRIHDHLHTGMEPPVLLSLIVQFHVPFHIEAFVPHSVARRVIDAAPSTVCVLFVMSVTTALSPDVSCASLAMNICHVSFLSAIFLGFFLSTTTNLSLTGIRATISSHLRIDRSEEPQEEEGGMCHPPETESNAPHTPYHPSSSPYCREFRAIYPKTLRFFFFSLFFLYRRCYACEF
jgi:hypothetical protein